MKDQSIEINDFINSVIIVADKFIKKVKTGRATSVVTYADLQNLKEMAKNLKKQLKVSDDN